MSQLTDPSNRLAHPGDSLKEVGKCFAPLGIFGKVLSVVASNLDAMARIFWEELLNGEPSSLPLFTVDDRVPSRATKFVGLL